MKGLRNGLWYLRALGFGLWRQQGLGFGCATALAQEGVNLVINARNAEALQTAVQKLQAIAPQVQVIGVAADITTPEGRSAVFEASGGPGKDFDIVVTNAGGRLPATSAAGIARPGSRPWTPIC